jgi:phage terminase large subunit-like protein
LTKTHFFSQNTLKLWRARVKIMSLPHITDLAFLAPIDRTELALRLKHAQLKKKRQNIEKSIGVQDIADWAESKFYDPQFCKPDQTDFSNVPLVKLTPVQKRILRHCFTVNPRTGRFPYRTYILSKPKKSGKTTEGAIIGSWFADQIESPNAVKVLANDQKQSSGRAFAFMLPTLKALGARRFETPFKRLLPNGTVISASTSDPESEAGDTYGLTLWDELWGYTSDRSRLLWDELMPILTRNISIRVVTTYAGFENASDLLLEQYLTVFKNTQETELQEGVEIVEELKDITTTNANGDPIPTCYHVPKTGLFYYNDHDQRMPWQQGEAADQLRAELEGSGMLKTNIYRLMENRWQLAESRFLEPDEMEAAFEKKESVSRSVPMTFAIDASQRWDCTAIAGSYLMEDRYVTGIADVWYPKGLDIDLEETVMKKILEYLHAGLILRREPTAKEKQIVKDEGLICLDVWYDPTQMHQVMMNLRKKHKVLIAEFGQSRQRLLADTFLLQQYRAKRIDNCDSPELQSHLTAAQAASQTDANQELIRIVKGSGKHAKAIDLAVAQSMSIYQTSKRPKVFSTDLALLQGSAKGWSKK